MGDAAGGCGEYDAQEQAAHAEPDGEPGGAVVHRSGGEQYAAEFDHRDQRRETGQGADDLEGEDGDEAGAVGAEQAQEHLPGGRGRASRIALRTAAVRHLPPLGTAVQTLCRGHGIPHLSGTAVRTGSGRRCRGRTARSMKRQQ